MRGGAALVLLCGLAVRCAGASDAAAARLLEAYVRQHAATTEAVVARVRADPCGQRFVSADFWGRGLGNSVNVALNALAFAVAGNRTLLVSDDKRFRAGFWRYLGRVDRRWATAAPVRAAFDAAGGCARCGCAGGEAEVVRDFFPLGRACLADGSCGGGVAWLLCDASALGARDARFVHVRSAVTWLAPLLAAAGPVGARSATLFAPRVNAWGRLYAALLGGDDGADGGAVAGVVARRVPPRGRFDVGVHVRHRRHQPPDVVDANAARCAGAAVAAVAAVAARGGTTAATVFVATDAPSRLPAIEAAIAAAAPGVALTFASLNASAVEDRAKLAKLARTDVRAVLAGRDWGELAHERWASVADFRLVAASDVVVGALSSTFSELAGAVGGAETYLYDPIFQARGADRTRYNWPKPDEYLRDHSDAFRCLRADTHWPLPQYVKLRPEAARAWAAAGGCPAAS